VDDDLGTGDRLGDSPPCGQVTLDPLDRRILAGRPGQDAHLVALACQEADDVPAQVPGAAGDENPHARPLLRLALPSPSSARPPRFG
jgi:hypothetical protein